jgi:MFS family permease
MYSRGVLRAVKNYQVNFIIKILILSDFLIWSSYQFVTAFFAIFITDKIQGGSIEVVGLAVAIYLFTKSIFEVPMSMYIDRTKSEKDDLISAIFGTILTAVVYFGYTAIDTVLELYILQALQGIAAAIAFPGWYAIFTRHIDKGKEAFEWSLYDVFLGLGMAAAAALGGFIAESFGFNTLFILVGILTLLGAFLLLTIKRKIFYR